MSGTLTFRRKCVHALKESLDVRPPGDARGDPAGRPPQGGCPATVVLIRPRVARPRLPILALTLSLAVPTLAPATGRADSTGSYDKTFYTSALPTTAEIFAGALIETWSGEPKVGNTVTYKAAVGGAPAVSSPYDHANAYTDTSPKTINGGLGANGMADTGFTVQAGYNPGKISIDTDNHTKPNSANAQITVDPLMHVGPMIDIRKPPGIDRRVLVDSVRTELSGMATAGTPSALVEPTHKLHSADSFAGVEIVGAKSSFKVTTGGAIPTVEAFQQSLFKGGTNQIVPGLDAGKALDPVFVTVNDQTTGVVFRQVVMTGSVTWTQGTFSVDQSGITLAINRNDPTASVALDFSNASSWVTNPYSYGATLDSTGFTAFGETPLSGWTLTQGPDTTQAFFAFGPDGAPFDSATVQPPASLFTTGDTYSYDVGTGGGVFELAAAVPEPSPLVLSGVVAFSLLAWVGFRRIRSSGVTGGGWHSTPLT